MVLSGQVQRNADGTYTALGRAEVMYALKIAVHFGREYTIYSEPVTLG